MDSVTQIVLGSAVSSAVIGRQVGAKAVLWGALLGTLPDLDTLIPMGGAVADFVYHRSFSHSLFVLAALTSLLVWLILKLHPQTREHRWRWAVAVYAVLATHVLLDSFTVYGTQIFWPLTDYPVALGSVFIIDPSYTVPMLIGVLVALFLRHSRAGYRANLIGIGISSLYLAWGVGAQAYVTNLAEASLDKQSLTHQRLLVTPTPFNSLMWRVIAVDDDHYRIGYYSLLDNTDQLDTVRYPRSPELLKGLESHWPVLKLQWFSKGFYTIDAENNAVVISDLRMGLEPDFAFRFVVGEIDNPHPTPVPDARLENPRNWDQLPTLMARIWDSSVRFEPGLSR
ncbi:metal-dependent hydrolase [Motiliproteus sp.]|uniref:metal-dependent hydrolase n=1 Tax=Motiliproteus sp. TaxID=1898955 RepID=UPI003BAA99C8